MQHFHVYLQGSTAEGCWSTYSPNPAPLVYARTLRLDAIYSFLQWPLLLGLDSKRRFSRACVCLAHFWHQRIHSLALSVRREIRTYVTLIKKKKCYIIFFSEYTRYIEKATFASCVRLEPSMSSYTFINKCLLQHDFVRTCTSCRSTQRLHQTFIKKKLKVRLDSNGTKVMQVNDTVSPFNYWIQKYLSHRAACSFARVKSTQQSRVIYTYLRGFAHHHFLVDAEKYAFFIFFFFCRAPLDLRQHFHYIYPYAPRRGVRVSQSRQKKGWWRGGGGRKMQRGSDHFTLDPARTSLYLQSFERGYFNTRFFPRPAHISRLSSCQIRALYFDEKYINCRRLFHSGGMSRYKPYDVCWRMTIVAVTWLSLSLSVRKFIYIYLWALWGSRNVISYWSLSWPYIV